MASVNRLSFVAHPPSPSIAPMARPIITFSPTVFRAVNRRPGRKGMPVNHDNSSTVRYARWPIIGWVVKEGGNQASRSLMPFLVLPTNVETAMNFFFFVSFKISSVRKFLTPDRFERSFKVLRFLARSLDFCYSLRITWRWSIFIISFVIHKINNACTVLRNMRQYFYSRDSRV